MGGPEGYGTGYQAPTCLPTVSLRKVVSWSAPCGQVRPQRTAAGKFRGSPIILQEDADRKTLVTFVVCNLM